MLIVETNHSKNNQTWLNGGGWGEF